jgi:hypothetical protein
MNELTGLLLYGHGMDHADVLHALCKVGRVEDSLGDGDSNTIERLRVGEVKLRVARYEQTNGESDENCSCEPPMLLNVLERRLETYGCVQCARMIIFQLITY